MDSPHAAEVAPGGTGSPRPEDIQRIRDALGVLFEEIVPLVRRVRLPTREWWRVHEHGARGISYSRERRPDTEALSRLAEHAAFKSEALTALSELLVADPLISDRFIKPGAGSGPLEEKTWARFVTPLLLRYLSLHAGAGTGLDHELLDWVFAEAEPHLSSPTLRTVRIAPLVHLRMEVDEITVHPGVAVRRVTAREIEDWINPRWGIYDLPISADQALEIEAVLVSEWDKRPTHHPQSVQKVRQQEDDLVTAIQLRIDSAVLRPFSDEYSCGSFRINRSRSYHETGSHYVRGGTIGSKDAEEVRVLWKQLQRGPNRKVADLAVRRWNSGIGRARDEDKLIDYWVALESLFARDATSELTFRVALRIAAFLGVNSTRRAQLYRRMRGLYGYRSAIVHGAPEGQLKRRMEEEGLTLSGAEDATRSVLRASLLRVLTMKEQFTPDTIERDLLAATGSPDAEEDRGLGLVY